MTRKKVKLAYITNDAARKATYKKRKKGLIKKVSELSTLCDIDACAIIYSPYDTQPEVYPSPLGVQRILAKFKNMPEIEKSKKMVNQESFLRQRIAKVNEQLKKQKKENREKEITQLMFQGLADPNSLLGLSLLDLNDVDRMIDQYLKDINERMEKISLEQAVDEDYKPSVVVVQAEPTATAESSSAMQRYPKWIMDLMINSQLQQQQHNGLQHEDECYASL
ncbi:hypothetical protein TIFTF001_014927 [Ficus carica]|uniref:MADS-box domain-containing protein n=1 Tax=Ficus carica TaxID=3494 RepID=A0AA88A3K4_FICCA|nr:hypothetical protein TIFTF001_014927 [Ficus carica]